MYARSRKKCVALVAQFAVIFAALLPASFAGTAIAGDAVNLGGICSPAATTAIDRMAPGNPAMRAGGTTSHGQCTSCTLGALFVDAGGVVSVVAIVDAFMPVLSLPGTDALALDRVAFHPLSPRAPPQAI